MERQTVKVSRARKLMLDFYLTRMHYRIDVKKSVINKIENDAIIIIDEIDKITNSGVVPPPSFANLVPHHDRQESQRGRRPKRPPPSNRGDGNFDQIRGHKHFTHPIRMFWRLQRLQT